MNKATFAYLSLPLALASCQTLPSLTDRSESHYIDVQAAPVLEAKLTPATNGKTLHPHTSGIYLLGDALDAFVARATLIESAEYTLDLQYYIWHNDVSGRLLFNLLQRAADRGVRVRLLLDDNNTKGLDNILAALNSNPNIQIRLFNPFITRKWRAIGYLTDFPRLNRRMHNKSLTADNHATILGGRNIGDEYFNVESDTAFADLDILAIGSVVTQVSQDFDRYWASHSSYPLERILKHPDTQQGFIQLAANSTNLKDQKVLNTYIEKLNDSPLLKAIENNAIPWQQADAELISDDPAKGLNRSRKKPDIDTALTHALKIPQHEIYLVSPYFVPTKKGSQALQNIAKRGVKVTVLTNSLQATDVAAVHSGYMKYRKPLLQSGIELYELKPNHAVPTSRDRGLTGSASTSLHAKTFVVDQKRVFIGSLNLDPRSARLNTEMGVVINSSPLAIEMERNLEQITPRYAYKVTLNKHDKLQWHDPETGKVHHHEPEASFWKRITAKVLSFLPIEGLL